MKKILISFLAGVIALSASAQKRHIDAHWCALGTSITWFNEHVSDARGGFTKGYQTRVMEKLNFAKYSNQGVSGGALATTLGMLIKADYYTIEHGVNDWSQGVPVGTFDDYVNNRKNNTFAAIYRQVIDAIYALNPNAKIVLCTPRKGAGFMFTYLGYYACPVDCDADINGVYLKQYADMVRQIAEYESLPVADFFNTGINKHNIYLMSLNDARKASDSIIEDGVHPNDPSYQIMANLVIDALERVLVD